MDLPVEEGRKLDSSCSAKELEIRVLQLKRPFKCCCFLVMMSYKVPWWLKLSLVLCWLLLIMQTHNANRGKKARSLPYHHIFYLILHVDGVHFICFESRYHVRSWHLFSARHLMKMGKNEVIIFCFAVASVRWKASFRSSRSVQMVSV